MVDIQNSQYFHQVNVNSLYIDLIEMIFVFIVSFKEKFDYDKIMITQDIDNKAVNI